MQHQNSINTAHFSQGDGKLVATASDDRTVRVWNGFNGLPHSEVLQLGSPVDEARFASNSEHLRILLESGESMLVTMAGGKRHFVTASKAEPPLKEPALDDPYLTRYAEKLRTKHSGEVTRVDLDPGGQIVASGSTDRTARLWDAKTLDPIAEPLVHDSTVNCVRFSPDGLRLVTSTARPTRLRIWDVKSGQPLTDWIESPEPVASVAFSADRAWVVTSAGLKWAVYPVSKASPKWLPELAEAIAGFRYNSNRILEPAPKDAYRTAEALIRSSTDADPLLKWAKELVSGVSAAR
jgi:WD40 repeat protein